MSVAAVAESILTYSFTHYFPLKSDSIKKEYQANNGDLWEIKFTCDCPDDSSVSMVLKKRTVGNDCCFNVKLSVLDGERQCKLDLVKIGWQMVGAWQRFLVPNQVVSDLKSSAAGQIALQMTITKVVTPSMVDEYSRLFKSESFGDVEIECADGVKFRCHKDMLAARSHHFATMFNLKMKESVENRIRIEDFNSDVVYILLKFVYMGDWGNPSGVADRLYVAADRYQLEQLKLAAAAVLNLNLNAESIVSTLQLAQLYKVKSLVDGCIRYLASHEVDLSAMEVLAEAQKNL